MSKKILALFMALLILTAVFSACSNNNTASTEPPATAQPTPKPTETPKPSAAPSEAPAEAGFKLPITDEKTEISIFTGAALATGMSDMNEGTVWKEAEKRTNIHVVWDVAVAGALQEEYNLLIASNKYPDVINVSLPIITGGLDKLVDDGVVYDLTDKLDTLAPNYQRWRTSSPSMSKDTTTDSGRQVGFHNLLQELQASYYGPVVRQDLLDKVGYKGKPTTYDEWTEMLRALKSVVDVAPYYLPRVDGRDTSMLAGLGFDQELWQTDGKGKVTFAPLETNWKYYLNLMSGWYKEGLMDPDWPTEASILRGKYEMILGNDHAAFGSFFTMLTAYETQASVEGYLLTPLEPPVLNKGDKRQIRLLQVSAAKIKDGISMISTQTKDFDTTCRWLDYFYTDEGILLAGYGVEGETFYFNAKGEPKLTELVAKNPKGISMSDTQTIYTAFSIWSTIYQWKREWHDWTSEKEINACKTWDLNYQDKLTYPQGASLSTDESAEFSSIMGDIITYVNEQTAIFLTGNYTEADYNKFVAQIKTMNIDKAIALKQAALDRYNAR